MFRRILKWSLVVSELVLSAGAVFGGVQLLRDPTGALLGMPVDGRLPAGGFIDNWRIPGVLLLIIAGIGPLVMAIATIQRRQWAREGHVFIGLICATWMAMEMTIIGIGAGTQIFYLAMSLLVTALGIGSYVAEDRADHHHGLHAT